MKDSWGRFTVRGSDAVEARVAALVEEVGVLVQSHLPEDKYRALILIGGYGRGEGGVEIRGGVERPHNNLDFLLLTESVGDLEASTLQRDLDLALAAMEKKHDLGLDVSLLPAKKLRNSPCLVMWYDMRFGHKTIVGDAAFVPSLQRFSVGRILPSDILWLLVNRGSQILVNDLLLHRGEPTEEELRYIVKLSMKAIIGYGDALLYFLGDYHWSYQEKARRVQVNSGIEEPFKRLYAEAVEFRFQPDYGPYLDRDMKAWMDSLRVSLEEVHIKCESLRLGRTGWTWDEYPSFCLRRGMIEAPFSLRATAKKALNLLWGPSPPANIRGLDRLACKTAGARQVLLACYPAAVYRLESESFRRWAHQALGSRDATPEELRIAFLYTWGKLVDPNFFKVVKRFDLFDMAKEHRA